MENITYILLFQSTCPRGARLYLLGGCIVSFISIHVPTRGTTISDNNHDEFDIFQSTCPRGARRTLTVTVGALSISIHVPTRGTTKRVAVEKEALIFQSTCPRGARRRIRVENIEHLSISIHVPTRGTTPLGKYRQNIRNFNPRAHEGHDSFFRLL